MKTQTYNPSQLEVEFAGALEDLKDQIEEKLSSSVIEVTNNSQKDNPSLIFHLLDADGDPHEIVVKIIQKPDTF